MSRIPVYLHDLQAASTAEELLQQVARAATELPTADFSQVALLDSQSERLVVRAAYGWPPGADDLSQPIPNPASLISRAFAQRAAVIVGDFAHAANDPSLPLTEPPIRSAASVPITFGEQTLGALIAYSRQGDHFGQSEIETLALLASQAAIALDKARLVEEFQRQKRELLGLYDTALATTSALETDILLSRLYEHMRQLLAPDTLVVALIDPAHQALDVVAAFEHDQKLPNFRVPLAEGGLTGWVVRNKQSLLVGDLQTDPLPTTLVHITEPARAWLGVPLVAREQVIGAISVQSFRPRQFDRGHQRFLETLANQVAVALSNARLFEASRHHTEDLQSASEILRALNAAPAVTDAFPALVTGLKAITRCERLSLALLDERRENALFIALDKPQVDLQQGSRLPVIATAAAADVLAGRAHLTPDLSLETHFPAEERLFAAGYRSRLNLPLRAGERVIGALNFAWRQTAGYDPAHLPLLTQIANAVALALEKDRLFDEARRRDAILGALATIGERLLAADDLSGVLPAVLARLGETTGVSRAFIFENHSEPSPLPLSLQPSPPTGSGGEVGGEGSVLLTDLRYEWTAPGQPSEMDDPRVHNMPYHASEFGRRRLETLGAGHVLHGLVRDFPEADRKVLGPRGVLAVVDVPIFSDGKWWGILGFDECARERVWSTAEIEALRSAAGALGAAFARQHSRQVEREQQALAEALRDTAAALNSTLKFEEVLDRILANVGRVVPHDAANIMLIEDGIARVVGCRGYAERGIEELVMAIRFRVADLPNLQHMVESGLPYAVPDTQAYEGWAELEETRWVRSYAGAPIRVKGEVIGFLNLDSAVPNFYTQALAERLAAFTDQAALAIENARLFEAERVGHGVTAALLDITQVAGSSLDLQHVLKVIAQRTAQACQAQRCTILMLDRAQQMLRPAMAQFADGHVERANWTRFKTSEPVALSDAPLLQALVRERAPMVWPDEKRGVTIPADWIQPYGVQKLLMVPLLGHDRVIGVLMLDLATADREFTPGQINLARAIGGQVASAIMNAESYATAEQRARESSTLARVGEALNRAMTAEETLQFVLAEAIKMVSRPEGSIILVERESEVLRMAANHGRSAEFVEAFNAQRLKPDLSTFAQSIGQGEMVEIADTTGDPRIAQLGIRNFPKQVTNVPLKTANGVLGVIVLNGLPHDDHARSFLRALADLAAAAIEKTHLLEESRRRAAQLEALRLASEQLTAQLELDVLLRHVLTILEKDFGYGATIFLVDSPTGELVWTVGTHPPGRAIQAKNLRLKIGEGISGRVAATGVPLLIQDTQAEPRYLADPSGPSRSAIAVPLKTGADTIGVLHVYRAAPHTLGYEDLRLLQTLGDQVAIALVNARLYAEVKQLAITDGLTGLPNHRHFFELADREFERARRYERPLSAIMVDIDHFKQVNDTYGHAVGNEVLRALAERCKGGPHSAGKLRDIDIMGRYGGDEFSIAVPENDLHSTQVLAERLQRYMADTPVPTQGGPLPITISLGLAERLEDCPDFHTMLNRADAAMYAARAGGRRNFLGW